MPIKSIKIKGAIQHMKKEVCLQKAWSEKQNVNVYN